MGRGDPCAVVPAMVTESVAEPVVAPAARLTADGTVQVRVV